MWVKKSLSLILVSLVLSVGIIPSAEAGDPVSRANFLVRATKAFYGDLEEYSAPFANVPDHARNAIGIARVLDALKGWGSGDADWETPVTRGQALEICFALAEIQPEGKKLSDQYRDIRGRENSRLVQQALAWRLMEPLSSRYFGWNRTLSSSELDIILERMTARLSTPLVEPSISAVDDSEPRRRGTQRARTIRQRQTPSRTRTGKTTKEPKKATITIELGGVDRGSRVQRFKRTELPRGDLLETVWGLVQSRYLYQDRIDPEEIAYSMAEKMMKLLDDPYSEFMRPSRTESFQTQMQGELSGIGAQVQLHEQGGVEVVTPLTGSPALEAGVRPGDRITHVDGEEIVGLNLHEAVMKIRGPVGSKVELTIVRGGGKILVNVVRDKIILPEITVTHQDGVAVVKLMQFGEKSREEFTSMMQEAVKDNPAGIILDLRNNPGGLLDAAVDVCSHFIGDGAIVAKIESQENTKLKIVQSPKDIVPKDMPVIVLVNNGSASASEIVAGALQDHGRATVVGQKTFGKGTVQEVVQFHTGESAKMTVAQWHTPLGRSIEKEGVMPDIEIDESPVGGRDDMLLDAMRLIKEKARKR